MEVRSEAVQIRVLAEEIGVRPRRRSLPYVEQPDADFFSQSAEMCRRSRTFMNSAGYRRQASQRSKSALTLGVSRVRV